MKMRRLVPLLMMRTRGLLGVIAGKHVKQTKTKSKSSGTQVKLGIV